MGQDVDAGVDQANSLEAQWDSRAIDVAVRDLLVLRLEEVGESGPVVASVAFGPNAEFVVLGLVYWESTEVSGLNNV